MQRTHQVVKSRTFAHLNFCAHLNERRWQQADALLHMQSAHPEDLPPGMPAAAGNLDSHGGIAAGSIDDDDEYAVPDMLFSATLPQDENIEEEREHGLPAAQPEDKRPRRRPGWQFAIFRDRMTKRRVTIQTPRSTREVDSVTFSFCRARGCYASRDRAYQGSLDRRAREVGMQADLQANADMDDGTRHAAARMNIAAVEWYVLVVCTRALCFAACMHVVILLFLHACMLQVCICVVYSLTPVRVV